MNSGILLIDKPEGVTSFEVVRRARRALKVKKIGHLGTLDPFATGLLPLCLQEATKLVPYLMPEPKTYQARVKLGVATDTQDLTGQVVARCETLPGPDQVRREAGRFVGEINQVPPMYSAVHHEGERLYRLARRGVRVEPESRQVTIYRLEIEEMALPEVTLRVKCSQGTYIRTLAHDLGAALGCGGHLAALRRLAVGPFRVEEALPLAALVAESSGELLSGLIPLARCLPGMKRVKVAPEQARHLRQGRPLNWPHPGLAGGETVQIETDAGLVALARMGKEAPQPLLSPVRVFATD